MTNVKTILDTYKVVQAPQGNTHYRHGRANTLCPFCNHVNYLLGFNLSYSYPNCYNCGPKRLADAIAGVCRISVKEAMALTKDMRRGSSLPTARPTGKYNPPKGIKPLMSMKLHREYIRSRRLDPKLLEEVWNVGAIGELGHHKWRIFIPILVRGRPVSWTTRSISKNNTLRYLSASFKDEELSAKTILYGEDFCGDTILVMEGAMGVYSIGAGSVATLGTGYTPEQFARMTKYAKRYVCFDNEPAAQRRARKLFRELSVLPGKTWNMVIDAKDPNEASEREKRLIRKTVFGM